MRRYFKFFLGYQEFILLLIIFSPSFSFLSALRDISTSDVFFFLGASNVRFHYPYVFLFLAQRQNFFQKTSKYLEQSNISVRTHPNVQLIGNFPVRTHPNFQLKGKLFSQNTSEFSSTKGIFLLEHIRKFSITWNLGMKFCMEKKLLPTFALSRGKTTLMSEIFASKAIREIFRISREF